MRSSLLLVVFGLCQLSLPTFADYEELQDSNSLTCIKLRQAAMLSCHNEPDCYTAELSRLVDLYNSQQERDSEYPSQLNCTY